MNRSPETQKAVELVRIRMARAKKKIQEFHAMTSNFFGSQPYSVSREVQAEGTTKVVSFTFRINHELPGDFALVFGECIHLLRSTCDHVIVALGRAEGVPGANRLFMPVCIAPDMVLGVDKNQAFSNFRKCWSKLSPDVLNAIEAIQPYNPHATPDGPLVFVRHPLHVLNQLSIEDKHRATLEVAGVNHGSLLIGKNGPVRVQGMARVTGGGIKNGEVFAVVPIPLTDSEDNINANVAVSIVCRGCGDIPTTNALNLLIDVHNFVTKEVVQRFAPLFSD